MGRRNESVDCVFHTAGIVCTVKELEKPYLEQHPLVGRARGQFVRSLENWNSDQPKLAVLIALIRKMRELVNWPQMLFAYDLDLRPGVSALDDYCLWAFPAEKDGDFSDQVAPLNWWKSGGTVASTPPIQTDPSLASDSSMQARVYDSSRSLSGLTGHKIIRVVPFNSADDGELGICFQLLFKKIDQLFNASRFRIFWILRSDRIICHVLVLSGGQEWWSLDESWPGQALC